MTDEIKTLYTLAWFDNIPDEDGEHLLVGERYITDFFTEKELMIFLGESNFPAGEYDLSLEQCNYLEKMLPMEFDHKKYSYQLGICGDYSLHLKDLIFTPAPAHTFTDKPPIDRIDAEKAFLSNNPETIIDALERITFFDTSPFYIQEKCIKHLKSDNIDIQIKAITSTGYLALLHGKLDKDKVIPLIESLSKNPALTQLTKDTLEDIEDNLQVRRRSDD